MGELVREQTGSRDAGGWQRTLLQEDVAPDRDGPRPALTGDLVTGRIVMETDVAEVVREACLHGRPDRRVQGNPAARRSWPSRRFARDLGAE
jgi:hypothetical protein